VDSELNHGDEVCRRGDTEAVFTMDLRHSYDEAQALEIIATEPGWMHGERFYDLRVVGFEDSDLFIQDFGFRGPGTHEEFWRSIMEEDETVPSEAFDARAGFGLFWNEALQAVLKWDPAERLRESQRKTRASQTPT
jgi:hypothetical protein